jgi:hypothetical protein
VTGLPSTPTRNVTRQPQARRACVNPFNIRSQSYHPPAPQCEHRKMWVSRATEWRVERPASMKPRSHIVHGESKGGSHGRDRQTESDRRGEKPTRATLPGSGTGPPIAPESRLRRRP